MSVAVGMGFLGCADNSLLGIVCCQEISERNLWLNTGSLGLGVVMNGKKIIAVRGMGDCGKTTTIKMVPSLIKERYPSATFDWIKNRVEIRVVITVNGVKIGIVSKGDPGSNVADSIRNFVDKGCKIIVCATRLRGKTVDDVNLFKEEYEIEWIEKKGVLSCDPGVREQDNNAVASEILGKIRAVIDK